MLKSLVLARRELGGYFFSPIAYIIGAMFLSIAAFKLIPLPGVYSTWFILSPGNEGSLRPLFEAMAYMMVVAVPLLTMRLMSEEFRSGTIEKLMTAPISDTEVVLGKFLGVLGFYVVLLASTVIFLAIVAAYGQPDGGVAAMGYLGMLLLGAAFISVGVFASTITRYQIVAALTSIAILALFALLMQPIVTYGPEPLSRLASRLNAMTYLKDFAKGIFDTRGAIYFLSATAIFLFLSVKALESRRWR